MSLKLRPRSITNISYTFLVSLPKEWTDYHQLKKRDQVSVEIGDDEDGRALILRPLEKTHLTLPYHTLLNTTQPNSTTLDQTTHNLTIHNPTA